MRGHHRFPWHAASVAILALLLLAGDAMAYVGPTPGPEFFGYFLSLISLIAVIFSSVVLWPLQAFWRRLRRASRAQPISAGDLGVESPTMAGSERS